MAALFFAKPRAVIAAEQEWAMAEAFDGPVEIDESYFGGRWKDKGAGGGRATLLPIVRRWVAPNSVVYSDSRSAYDTLWVEGYRHERVDHGEGLVADGGRHISGIENFWSQAKRHLRRFNGVPKGSFPLFLQEVV